MLLLVTELSEVIYFMVFVVEFCVLADLYVVKYSNGAVEMLWLVFNDTCAE